MMIFPLFIFLWVIRQSSSIESFEVNNGNSVSLKFNTTGFLTGFMYISDPVGQHIGIYFDNKRFIFGPLYKNTSTRVDVSTSVLEITLDHVDKTRHGGKYTCSPQGPTSTKILPYCDLLLVVRDIPTRPVITHVQQPVYGQEHKLKCSSRSTSVPTRDDQMKYEWFRNDVRLGTSSSFTIHDEMLTFNVTQRDEYQFECTARESTFVTDISEIVFLPDYGPFDLHVNKGNHITPTAGTNVILSCRAKCSPSCRYSWFFQDKSVRGPEHGKLSLTELDRRNSGSYKCTASNKYGVLNTYITVDVIYPPLTSTNESRTTLVENEKIILQCRVDSNPQPDVTWLKDGVIVPGLYLENFTRTVGEVTEHVYLYTFKREKARCKDAGSYVCRADNGVEPGSESSSRVAVKCAIRSREKKQAVRKLLQPRYTTLVLKIRITAYPRPVVVRWTRGEEGLETLVDSDRLTYKWSGDDNGYDHQLTLTHPVIVVSDNGVYKIELDNGFPQTYSESYSITVQEPPDRPTDLAVISYDHSTVTVTWRGGFDGHSKQRYEVFLTSENTSRSLLTEHTRADLVALESATVFIIAVRAMNDMGISELSEPLRIVTPEAEESTSYSTTFETNIPLHANLMKSDAFWSAVILGVLGTCVLVLVAGFCILKRLKGSSRVVEPNDAVTKEETEIKSPSALIRGQDPRQSTSSERDKEPIYDEVELASRPPSTVLLRPTRNIYTPLRRLFSYRANSIA